MEDKQTPSSPEYVVPTDSDSDNDNNNDLPDDGNPFVIWDGLPEVHGCGGRPCLQCDGLPAGIIRLNPPPPCGSYVYQSVVNKIKEQLGYTLDRKLEDIPAYRIDDIGVAVKSDYTGKVRELLQRRRNNVGLNIAQAIFLRQHIGWQEIECHDKLLEEDRTLYTMTDKPPRVFFSPNEIPNCIECSSTHNVNAVRRSCFPLDQHGPQDPSNVTHGHRRQEQIQAIYVGTENMYLHPTLFNRILNLSLIHKGMGYKVGFEAPFEALSPTQECLLTKLRDRASFKGMPSVPIIVEFSRNPDVAGPISQHLIGFLRMLTKLRPAHTSTVVMAMLPPLPTGATIGDNVQYTVTLRQFEKDCKMAKMLGEALGILVHKFDMFETEVHRTRYWYRRKTVWSSEPLFGSTGRPTREWFDRQTDNFEQLLEALRRAELA